MIFERAIVCARVVKKNRIVVLKKKNEIIYTIQKQIKPKEKTLKQYELHLFNIYIDSHLYFASFISSCK